MKYVLGIGLLILIIASLVTTHGDPGEENVITIGAVLSLSGDAAFDGESMRSGIELARRDLALRDIEIEVIYEDDETDVAKTVSATQKLLAVDNPDVVIGPTWSFLASAAAPVLDQAEIPFFMPGNTSEFVETESPYAFFGSTLNAHKEERIYEFFVTENTSRLAIVADNGAWGESHLEPIRNAAARAGVEIVIEEFVPFGQEASILPTILAQVEVADIDAIFWAGFDEGATVLLKKYVELGLTQSILSPEAWIGFGGRGEFIDAMDGSLYVLDTVVNNEYVAHYREVYGADPEPFSDIAYDGTMLLVEAIQAVGTDGPAIAEYLHGETAYEGFAKTYQFGETGDVTGGEWILKQLK